MSDLLLPPPLTAPDHVQTDLAAQGYAVLSSASVCALAGVALPELQAWGADWADLPPDLYLKDGGRYRRRRHASFVVKGDEVSRTPHRAHWQPLEYNALHGGMQRWFEPMLDATATQPAWARLLRWLTQVTQGVHPYPAGAACYLEAHQFRIDTTDGIGRPTPEGAHRDGVDVVAVFLVERSGIKGGETRVFDAHGPQGLRFTLTEPWSLLLLDDTRVIHESTPIQPLAEGAHRDTLVITLRGGGFQEDLQNISVNEN